MRAMKSIFQKRRDTEPSIMRRSPRQLWWGGIFLSNLIAMGSTFEAVRMQRYYSSHTNPTQRWAVGSVTAVFLLTFTSIALQMIPRTSHLLMGTKLELASILVASAFSLAAVGTATNPATGMAVNASGGVSFGNLYYSAWTSFGCGLALLTSFVRTERGFDVTSELNSRGKRFRLWVALAITSLIVMGSSASSYDAKCGANEEFRPGEYCRRAAFGVSAGCIGCVCSLAVVAMRVWCTTQDSSGESGPNKYIFAVECISSLILLCLYCFAVAYLTSEEGPGAPLGNLYYATWTTFGLLFFVAVSCYEEIQSAKSVYSLRNQQAAELSQGEVSSIAVSSLGRPAVDWRDNENRVIPVEPNRPEQKVFTQVPAQAILTGSIRSGSVGEVQVGV